MEKKLKRRPQYKRIIYYRIITIWHKWPYNNEVDYKFVEFYNDTKRKGSLRYEVIEGLYIESNTSIKEKETYLREKLQLNIKIEIIKLN